MSSETALCLWARWRLLGLELLCCLSGMNGFAQGLPHVGEAGQSEYGLYVQAASHRAFAIAPGGAWGWVSAQDSEQAARVKALAGCQSQTRQKCVLYAVDDSIVLDRTQWSQLWGPYLSAKQVQRVTVGRDLGQRFPALRMTDAQGRLLSVQSFLGKVLVLHFWGSWCGPCRREMPQLQRLHDELKQDVGVAFALLQVREKIAVSAQWAHAQGLHLPLYDSGSISAAHADFSIQGGGSLSDRTLASVFPTTYVLDKHGVVIFSHVGPVDDWQQYRDFLRDAARRSGR